MSKRKKTMIITVICAVVVLAAIAVFFKSHYSKTRSEFLEMVKSSFTTDQINTEYFREADILHLPDPVRNYFRVCGHIGTQKSDAMKATMPNVPFVQSKEGPEMLIDYTLFSFAHEPIRLALIETSMFGVPFEGLDIYYDGKGSMKGVIGKVITIFNQTGRDMDQGQLVTYLSECFMNPSVIFNSAITWESIDQLHAGATIEYGGISASGIFTFDENGIVRSFDTNDRAVISNDGTVQYVPWSAVYLDHSERDGALRPTSFQCVWHYEDGDFIYIHADNIILEYESVYN